MDPFLSSDYIMVHFPVHINTASQTSAGLKHNRIHAVHRILISVKHFIPAVREYRNRPICYTINNNIKSIIINKKIIAAGFNEQPVLLQGYFKGGYFHTGKE